jgi:hypothetical protein
MLILKKLYTSVAICYYLPMKLSGKIDEGAGRKQSARRDFRRSGLMANHAEMSTARAQHPATGTVATYALATIDVVVMIRPRSN